MPSRAHLMVKDGDEVQAGDVLAKIPRETTKTKDIYRRSPASCRTFRDPQPKDPAVISEIDGGRPLWRYRQGMRQKFTSKAKNGKTTKEYSIPRGVHINVQEGDHVKAGGGPHRWPAQPARLARRPRGREVQRNVVPWSMPFSEVYRLQGVNINDKHIETISRQMMRWSRSRTWVIPMEKA